MSEDDEMYDERQMKGEAQEIDKCKVCTDPGKPTKDEIEQHEATHAQYRSWCPHCVRGRGQSSPHKSTAAAHEMQSRVPTLAMDYFFAGQEDNPTETMIGIKDGRSKAMHAFLVNKKGVCDDRITKKIVQWIDALGNKRVVIKSDNEPSIVSVQEAVRKESITEMVPENSPKGESKSNGMIESAVRELEGMIRTTKDHIETKMGGKLDQDSPMLAWIVESAGTIITRYRIGSDGRTAYQRLKGKRPSNMIVPLGEKVLYLPLKTTGKMNKLAPKFKYGVYGGVNPRSSEALVSNEHGTFRARTIRRLADGSKWDADMIKHMKGAPWDLTTIERVSVSMSDRVDMPMEVPMPPEPEVKVRRLYVKRTDIAKFGYTTGCLGCSAMMRKAAPVAHGDECRKRVADCLSQSPEGADRVEKRRQAVDEAVAEAGEKMFEREKKQKLDSELRSGEPPAAARHDAAEADASMVPSDADWGCGSTDEADRRTR